MKRYLNNILNGLPLNANAFYKLCEKKGISKPVVFEVFNITPSTHGTKKSYDFQIKDEARYREVFGRFHDQDEDQKVEASLHGNSKLGKSACGALVYREHYADTLAQSLLFKDNLCLQPPLETNSVLIIENANTFVKLSPEIVPNISLDSMPVIWGRGTDITGAQYVDLLKRYSRIICFFDYDLGGLKAYASLFRQFGDKVTFYLHPQLDNCLSLYGKPLTQAQYLAIQNIAVDNSSKQAADILLRHKKWLEQEVLQADIIKG